MTQQYCRGDFVSWDPKITTFPGLYYLGVLYAWLSQLMLLWAGATLVRALSCLDSPSGLPQV
jgi:alpha-1,2-glucosyltransferase